MLLEMRDIRKSFTAGPVLHGVDFSVEAGEIHALIGHNGAGKSTLMKTLAGNFADYSGQIVIEGRDCVLHTPAEALGQGVAIIYQDFALVPDLSVAANIALGREPKGAFPGLMPHRALRTRSAREAALLGIDLPMDTPIRRLGVAAQQLTEIVRACSQDVRILVMDEPTARLAPAERAHLFAVMRRMGRERGVGIIYISHFLDEVRDIADRVTVMRDGRVVETNAASRYTVDDLAQLLVGHTDIVLDQAPDRRVAKQKPLGPTMLELDQLAVAGRPGVTLSVAAGEIVGLAGLVGSGRTRLARAMVGDVVSEGVLRVDGRAVTRRSPQRSAAAGLVMVPEDRKISGLALAASIEANMEATALGTSLSRMGIVRRARQRQVVDGLIRSFRIHPPVREKPVGTLSGGNAQKVLLARAVAARPRAMILDQPTAGVDIGAKAELHKLIVLAAAEGAAVVLISDDLDEILGLADRVVVMTEGVAGPPIARADLDRAKLLSAISRVSQTAA
ncbi:sugar ABC transporter ATP-binding protein [Acidisoma cellulosilytica]|uniref:Sugar ABC transporter ATP-binding protein n=1 Tax=Acidisoma cellulosilyticum TaxID=2802395 RepID=A0A963Z6M7_9PROT|nr:sugar ABC transporter ATP-binding protein [Acidisoma cellulosilyticum]MCB8883603.1 sugar ABC transporter ATP-binding protein [Acidisoma cellulosilyticum]